MTDVAVPDVIEYHYDQGNAGDVAANDEVKGSDYTDINGEDRTATDEVVEVVGMEMIPPDNTATTPDSLHTFESVQLWDGQQYYPKVRAREFMMGYFSTAEHQTGAVEFGTPVLSGDIHPDRNPIDSACPKYGPDTRISPAAKNDGTAIDDSFTIRLYVYRWQGTEREFQNYISSEYGSTSFSQSVSVSNPYSEDSRTYTRSRPIKLSAGGQNRAHREFTRLTGGINQETPKVYPWVTWSENNSATRTNTQYKFTTQNDRVDVDWKKLEFDYTGEEKAKVFETLAVNQPSNIDEGELVIEQRDEDPRFVLDSTDERHELPTVRDPDDATVTRPHDDDQLPVRLADRAGQREVLWADGGGFRVTDDGSNISSGDILVGVTGYHLELTS